MDNANELVGHNMQPLEAQCLRMKWILKALISAEDHRKSSQGIHSQHDDFFDWARKELERTA